MTATATRPHRPVRTLAALLAGLCLATAAWAADYASLVGQARDLLQEDRIVEALAVAKDAVRANGNDYKGHYYVALAYLGMGRFDEADEAARHASSLAPDSARAGVDKLVASILSRRQGAGIVQAAEAALADGLAGKAARLYEAAWSAGRDNPELGLKAADLYANRLNQPVDAGRVLRQVMQSAKGGPAADQAAGELRKLTTKLREISHALLLAATKQQGNHALITLTEAINADPENISIYKEQARLASTMSNTSLLIDAITNLARHPDFKPDELATVPRLTYWLNKQDTRSKLEDVLGKGQVNTIQALLEKNQADSINNFKRIINILNSESDYVFKTRQRPGERGEFQWGYMNFKLRQGISNMKIDNECNISLESNHVRFYSWHAKRYVGKGFFGSNYDYSIGSHLTKEEESISANIATDIEYIGPVESIREKWAEAPWGQEIYSGDYYQIRIPIKLVSNTISGTSRKWNSDKLYKELDLLEADQQPEINNYRSGSMYLYYYINHRNYKDQLDRANNYRNDLLKLQASCAANKKNSPCRLDWVAKLNMTVGMRPR